MSHWTDELLAEVTWLYYCMPTPPVERSLIRVQAIAYYFKENHVDVPL